MIKNWPPLSLINVHVKIIPEVSAKRLQKLLPILIHAKQKVLVKGRPIFDAVRTIDEKVDFTKRAHSCFFFFFYYYTNRL